MKRNFFIVIIIFFITSCLTPKSDPVPEEKILEENITVTEPIIIEEKIEPDIYVATEEVYDKTFEEVEKLINKLNKIISTGDFNTWKNYLSETYIASHDNKEYLSKLSDNPVLKDYGIKLKTLKDYFNYIVTPARSNVIIDEIQFISEDKLKAFTFKNSDKFVVYLLIKGDDGWIISD